MANRHERHGHYVLKRLEADIFAEIGPLPLSEIPNSAFRNNEDAAYRAAGQQHAAVPVIPGGDIEDG